MLAHEWGHVAQFEVGVDEATVIMEQQADCFAGAWLADLIDDPGGLSDLVEANPLDTSLASIIEFRDQPGSSIDDPNAHGTGFDRVRALQEGFETGRRALLGLPGQPADAHRPAVHDRGRCRLRRQPRPSTSSSRWSSRTSTTSTSSTSPASRARRRRRCWPATTPSNQLTDLHDRVGDNGAGVVLALVWARFAQQQTGSDEGRDEFGQLLQQACLTGGWFLEVLGRTPESDEGSIVFSPGDIDEAIIGLIDLGTPEDAGQTTDGGLFELVASLRQGITEGFDSCGLE